MQTIAIYGGSFDPVHLGHIKTACTLQQLLHFDKFLFLPCKDPVIKGATMANAQQRVEMLRLALAPYPDFTIDLTEINRATPSYMVDTLTGLRNDFPDDSLNLIIGMDAFAEFDKWHRWQNILTLSNLIVIDRPAVTKDNLPKTIKDCLNVHENNELNSIAINKNGSIYFINAGIYAIESRTIRTELKSGQIQSSNLPETVQEYIKSLGLYQ